MNHQVLNMLFHNKLFHNKLFKAPLLTDCWLGLAGAWMAGEVWGWFWAKAASKSCALLPLFPSGLGGWRWFWGKAARQFGRLSSPLIPSGLAGWCPKGVLDLQMLCCNTATSETN